MNACCVQTARSAGGNAVCLLVFMLLYCTALWVFITLLPTLILNSEKRDVPLGPTDYVGWGIWGLGFATEAIADQQKWNFKRDPDNVVSYFPIQNLYPMSVTGEFLAILQVHTLVFMKFHFLVIVINTSSSRLLYTLSLHLLNLNLSFLYQGKFIQSGLWAYSRHPNYLGEILQWSGLFLSASSVMRGPQYLSVVSPLFLWFLLRYVSGIPMLEKQGMKKWGADPAYQTYIQNTPRLWPWPKF